MVRIGSVALSSDFVWACVRPLVVMDNFSNQGLADDCGLIE